MAIEGVEDLEVETVFKGIFGDELAIVSDKVEKPEIPVTTKLTKREYEALEGWAYKFGISKYKFIRDCITKQMKDLTILTDT